jgi:hypothetical protein
VEFAAPATEELPIMAAPRTVVQSLTIALIVFVTLTFILAVTTYLGFTGKFDSEKQMKAEQDKAAEVSGKLAEQEKNNQVLMDAIGIAMTDPADPSKLNPSEAIQTWFTQRFGDFKEDPQSYEKLAEWLQQAVREKDSQYEKLLVEKTNEINSLKNDIQKGEARNQEFEKSLQAANQKATDAEKSYGEFRSTNEKEKEQLNGKYQAELKKTEQLNLIEQEVARAEDLVSARRVDDFKATSTKERVDIILMELRERERAINRSNELLAKLRVADPAIQQTIADAVPQDDRVDHFDGRVVSVNSSDRTALILCDSTRGLRPGLVLFVYDPDDPRPQVTERKGTVEVMAVESPTLVRARIRRDSVGDPILPGDGVATSLWEGGTQFTAVIVGFVQIDRDAGEDAARLKELIEGVGGRVETSVTPLTTMLIDAGGPRSISDDKAHGWQDRDKVRRDRELREARRLGVRVMGINQFMPMLGLGQDSLDANHLPDAAAR